MWLVMLAGLAMAQDDSVLQDRLLGPAASPAAELPVSETFIAPTPIKATSAPKTNTTAAAPTAPIASTPVDSGFLWSLAWPIGLVLGAGGMVWWARKKGLKIPGLSNKGFKAFATEGPSINVVTKTAIGTNTLAIVEVAQDGSPSRRLLISLSQTGSSLLADLDARPGVQVVQQPAPTQAMMSWAEPAPAQVLPQAAVPQAVPASPATAAAPAIAVPVMASAMATAPAMPTAIPEPAAQAQINTPAEQSAVRFDDQLDHSMADPGPRPSRMKPRSAPPSDDVGARSALQDRRHAMRPHAQDHQPEPDSALQRRPDWRSATYKSAQPKRSTDRLDELTERRAQRGRQPRKRAWDDDPRSPRRQSPARDGGHLSALTRGTPNPNARRVGGAKRSPIRTSNSREERTEAARALLEQVMSRRATAGDRR